MTTEQDSERTAATPARPLRGGRALAAVIAVAVGLVVAVAVVAIRSDGTETTNGNEVAASLRTDVHPATDTVSSPVRRGDVNVAVAPEGTGGRLTLTVADPATPGAAGSTARHCVLVTVTGANGSVEGYGCHDATDGSTSNIALSAPGRPSVGCAATASRSPRSATGTADTSSTFTLEPGFALGPGTYSVDVTATTGLGDGCAPADDGGAEHVGGVAAALTVH